MHAQEHARCSLELAALRRCLDAEQRAGMAHTAVATLNSAAAADARLIAPASPTADAPQRTGKAAMLWSPAVICKPAPHGMGSSLEYPPKTVLQAVQ